MSDGLLHNMSVPTKTTITHKAPAHRVYGYGIVIALPDHLANASSIELLKALGYSSRSAATADLELRELIEARARALPLAPAVAISAQTRDGDTECADLATIITVLAKSSSRVYLRDKEPNLSSISAGRRLVLLMPEEVRL